MIRGLKGGLKFLGRGLRKGVGLRKFGKKPNIWKRIFGMGRGGGGGGFGGGGGGLPEMPDIFSNRNPMDIMQTAQQGLGSGFQAGEHKKFNDLFGLGRGIGNLPGIFKPRTYNDYKNVIRWKDRLSPDKWQRMSEELNQYYRRQDRANNPLSNLMRPDQLQRLAALGGVPGAVNPPLPGGQGGAPAAAEPHHTMTPREFAKMNGWPNLMGGMGMGMPMPGITAPGYGSMSNFHYTNGRGQPLVTFGGMGGMGQSPFGGMGPGGQPFIPPWGEGYRRPGEPARRVNEAGRRIEMTNPGMGERMQGPWSADNRPPGGWEAEARDRGHRMRWLRPDRKRKWWLRTLGGLGRGAILNMKQGRNSWTNTLGGGLSGALGDPFYG